MKKTSRIYITGHRGLVGSALLAELKRQRYKNFVLRTSKELDLLDQQATFDFFEQEKPEYVFHLAAKVGGIVGNKTYPADFTYENLQINASVIHAAEALEVQNGL